MDRLDRLEQVARKAEELLAKVQALKCKPSETSPPVGEPLREIIGNTLENTKGRNA